MSTSERNEIVRVHNELRAKLANGQETFGKPGPQPPAADMETMVSASIIFNLHFDFNTPHFGNPPKHPYYLLQTKKNLVGVVAAIFCVW